MKYLKLFEAFDDLEFDFLATIPKVERSIIKSVEVHEKYYYNDVKISTNTDFISDIKSILNSTLKGRNYDLIYYLDLIKSYENELYDKNLFRLNDENCDESLGDILDGIVGMFNNVNKNKSEAEIQRLEDRSDNLLKNMSKDWVYQKESDDEENIDMSDDDMSDDDITDIDNNIIHDNPTIDIDGEVKTLDEFIEDIEVYIGKNIDDFDYGDRLQAYKYVENSEWIKKLLNSDVESDIDYVNSFLDQVKDVLFDL